MSPLFLYPALSGSKKQKKDEVFVFRNHERLDKLNTENPNTSNDVFIKEFLNPTYRIPAMVITNKGRIVVWSDYRNSAPDNIAIRPAVAYSDDGGQTWVKKLIPGAPWTGWPTANTRCMDGTMFIDKRGWIHVISGYWNGSKNNTNWTQTHPDDTWTVIEFLSKDDGVTWETKTDLKNRVNHDGQLNGKSWLGGVGNCVLTKRGTLIVPIQFSPSRGNVSMSFIYSTDGDNWKKFPGNIEGCSETSAAQFVGPVGNTDIFFMSRTDSPNRTDYKRCFYVTENGNGTFTKQTLTEYSQWSNKVPARGGIGCQGSFLIPSNENGNLVPELQSFVSFPANYISGPRNNLGIWCFSKGNRTNRAYTLEEIDWIRLNLGHAYSIMYYNHNANMMGIAYEDSLGIAYKDISELIPIFLSKPAS